LAALVDAGQAGDGATAAAAVALIGSATMSQAGNGAAGASAVAIAATVSMGQGADVLAAAGFALTRAAATLAQQDDGVLSAAGIALAATAGLAQASQGMSAAAALLSHGTAQLTQAGDAVSGQIVVDWLDVVFVGLVSSPAGRGSVVYRPGVGQVEYVNQAGGVASPDGSAATVYHEAAEARVMSDGNLEYSEV